MAEHMQGASMGFTYSTDSDMVEPVTPSLGVKVKDADDPKATRMVRQAQTWIAAQEPQIDPAKIGDPMEALNPEQAAAYHDDKRYRRDLVTSSGGEVSTWEGIEEAEANDPYMQSLVIAWEAQQRSERALRALLVYEGSPEVRVSYRLFEMRCEAKAVVRRFWAWLRR